MKNNKCLKCGYEWLPRILKPKKCPRCKTYYWEIGLDGKCEICKRIFLKLHTHHIDGNHENNKKKNRIRICEDCHAYIHCLEQTKKTNNHHRRIRDYNNPEIINKLNKYRNLWKH